MHHLHTGLDCHRGEGERGGLPHGRHQTQFARALGAMGSFGESFWRIFRVKGGHTLRGGSPMMLVPV